MATETVAAGGLGSPDDWSLAAGATKMAAVALPDDDGTSYITSTTTINTRQVFTCTPSVITTGSTITQVDVKARGVRGGANNVDFYMGYSFTPNGGGSQSGTSGTLTAVSAQTDFTYTHSGLSVAWGSALTIWIENLQAFNMRCTTFYVVLTYTPGGGLPLKTVYYARLRRDG